MQFGLLEEMKQRLIVLFPVVLSSDVRFCSKGLFSAKQNNFSLEL